MGGSNWSDSFYRARDDDRKSKGVDAFAYDRDIRSGSVATAVHDKMDPKGLKFRESRDSDAHPLSRPVAVWFDVTGSMSSVPRTLQQKLPELMALLIKKGYIGKDPQILFGAIGDATCDSVPLQVGQFESGIEMDDDLSRLYLEGGGGGHITESYELAMYVMARHTVTDSWEKRQEKGYLFIIGDETPYKKVKKSEVERLIGDTLQDDIPLHDIVNELKEKWEVFCIIPGGTSHANDDTVRDAWVSLFGQNVIRLQDATQVCETIALTIGVCEGKVDPEEGEKDLVDVGVDVSVARSVSKAIVPIGRGGAMAKPAVSLGATALADSPGDGGGVNRL